MGVAPDARWAPWHYSPMGFVGLRQNPVGIPPAKVEAGGLMAYGASFGELYRRAASQVRKILQGVNPGSIPVEQPTKFEFVLNMRTAKALGLTVSSQLLARADEIID
jgi:ABC-type uncharacterized transport system substrate-binding protein